MTESAIPQSDGALLVERPTAQTIYDFGNQRLFAQVDGLGNITRCNLVEGVRMLESWRQDTNIDWRSARAIGRLFTLNGHSDGIAARLDTFCAAGTAAVYQHWRLQNPTDATRNFELQLTVTLDLNHPRPQLTHKASIEATLKQLADPKNYSGQQGEIAQLLAGQMFHKSGADHSPQLESLPDGLLARNDGGNARITVWGLAADRVLVQKSAPGTAQINLSLTLAAGKSTDFCIGLLAAESATADAANAHHPAGWQAAYADAQNYARFLGDSFESDDPLLKSLFATGLNCAVAMYKELPSGFKGLWAGPGYAYPPRIYFRDGYWTAQALLPYLPKMVRGHLLALAQGVHDDGQCPSGVIDSGLFSPEHLSIPGIRDWLPDHHDSPAFFVLLLDDYLRWSRDWAVLDAPVDSVTVWQKAQACLAYLAAQDKNGDGLPEKAHQPNDWADNVVRDKYVTYDLALHYGALTAASAISERRAEPALAAEYHRQAQKLAAALNSQMWDESKGYYVDYRRDGFCEDHLALDTLVALRYRLAPPERRRRVLAAASRLLQSRHNPGQPWGDWGVMCCFPPYRRADDLFAKSADPYNYHNGGEWPYLSCMYAQLLLEDDDDEWYYVLTRWWERSLELGWLTPVEFTAPPHPPGAFLQGWSGMAAAALIMRSGE